MGSAKSRNRAAVATGNWLSALALLLAAPLLLGTAPLDMSGPSAAHSRQSGIDWAALHARALAGDPVAETELGRMFLAPGPSHDPSEAFRWFNHAIEHGDMPARAEAALLLLHGDVGPADPDGAVALLRPAAEAGDPLAEAVLGMLHMRGTAVPQSWPEALDWTTKAAQQGNGWAATTVGWMYALRPGGGTGSRRGGGLVSPRAGPRLRRRRRHARRAYAQSGAGVDKDSERAIGLYLNAAEANVAGAARMLGAAYQVGSGVAQDDRQAVAWLRRAAELQDAGAMSMLAAAYEQGRGVPADRLEAWQWSTRAAAAGDENAQAFIGIEWYWGARSPRRDHAEAAHWFEAALTSAASPLQCEPPAPGSQAADRLTTVRTLFGLQLIAGDGVGRDAARGVALLSEAAAAMRNAIALNELGRLRLAGKLVPKDLAGAVALFRQSVEKGNSAAAFNLGRAYSLGWSVAVDPRAAVGWYRVAAGLNYAEAWQALGVAYETGAGVPADAAEAFTWYRLAAGAGNLDAEARVGDALHFGHAPGSRTVTTPRRRAEYTLAARAGTRRRTEHPGLPLRTPGPASAVTTRPRCAGTGWRRSAARRAPPAALATHIAPAVSAWFRTMRKRWRCTAGPRSKACEARNSGWPGCSSMAAAHRSIFHPRRRSTGPQPNRASRRRRFGSAMPTATAGLGLAKDDAAALGWCQRAALADNADAEEHLGEFYQKGRGTGADLALALQWYGQAASHGNSYAETNLGVLHANGWGTAVDEAEALKWCRLAAEHGNPVGTDFLGDFNWFGKAGLPVDRIEAVRLYLIAAQQGNARAQSMLSLAYRGGDGVAADQKRMLFWSRKAAEQGDTYAQNSLGYSLLIGRNIPIDLIEACSWLILAVERSPAGELHDRATVNLRDAKSQLNWIDEAEAERRAGERRKMFP